MALAQPQQAWHKVSMPFWRHCGLGRYPSGPLNVDVQKLEWTTGGSALPRVAILHHRHESFSEYQYFLAAIAEIWSKQGVEVQILAGPEPGVDADLAICHVDLTVVPPEYLAYLRSFPAAVNGRAADISKRIVSRQLIDRNSAWDGPVIVKSDRNGQGAREARLASVGLMPPRYRPVAPSYAVFDSSDEVPDEVWSNRDLVVERFMPEIEDGLYCLRTWMFFGDRETNSICYSNERIVKAANVLRRVPLGEPPEQLRQIREELAFDFGKFDYAMVDGRPVLYDANRTPTLPNFVNDAILPRLRLLAEGLGAFLSEARR